MAKPTELHADAWQAYRQSRFQEAALWWIQASDVALEQDHLAEWYHYRVWAANALSQCNHIIQAMDILLDLRWREPENRPDYEAWIAQKIMISIVLQTNPDDDKLHTYLTELEHIASQQPAPAGDLPKLRADVLHHQGHFSAAFQAYEQAWHQNDGQGYVKYGPAYQAAACCLALNNISQAKAWREAGLATQEDHQGKVIGAAQLALEIAFAEVQTTDWIGLLSEYDAAVTGSQAGKDHDAFNASSVRVYLMDQAELDPLQPSHPAQQTILRRLSSYTNVHDQFEYRLLWVDFRLAAWRFALGIPAVEDKYYAQPQQLPLARKPGDRSDQQRRFHRVLASCQQAEQYGRKLDQLLQTTYRQDLIAKRRERIQAIQTWVTTMHPE